MGLYTMFMIQTQPTDGRCSWSVSLKRWDSNSDSLPANAGLWPNAGLMLGQRLRRWSSIHPASGESLVFCWNVFGVIGYFCNLTLHVSSLWYACVPPLNSQKKNMIYKIWLRERNIINQNWNTNVQQKKYSHAFKYWNCIHHIASKRHGSAFFSPSCVYIMV